MKKHKHPKSSRALPGIPSDLTSYIVSYITQLPSSPKGDYLKKVVMSKHLSSDTDPPQVRRTRAIRKWLATERENEATNDRLLIIDGEYNILPRVPFSSFVSWCQREIVDILGETPPIEALIGSFSGGASTSRPRTSSHPASKYLGKAHVTESCWDYFTLLEGELPGWFTDITTIEREFVRGNVLFTVPKNSEIDRVACKEPDLNMFIQKGVGNYFRNSLRRIGINLNDQSINKSLAREGSVTGKLATLDLSSASDSVSDGLVSLFLPVTWYNLLDAIRCHVTIIDGEEHRNHMFSSMGNGFTFELESLLFYVLARATAFFTGTRGRVSVYGDDIICPTGISAYLSFVLSVFGFSVNTDKSYDSGPFRESCGGHYHSGVDITPFYIKAPILNLIDLIHVCNQIREWADYKDGSVILDPLMAPLWYHLRSFIPRCLWGGGDTSFKYQLTSLDPPEKRIVESTRKRSTGHGGYFHWLNATWTREQATDGVETSSFNSPKLNNYRIRPVRDSAVPRLLTVFYEEVVTNEGLCYG